MGGSFGEYSIDETWNLIARNCFRINEIFVILEEHVNNLVSVHVLADEVTQVYLENELWWDVLPRHMVLKTKFGGLKFDTKI